MVRWKNENGEWVLLSRDRYGWIDYKKQTEACKSCKTGPWNMGAVTCVDVCQKSITYILERTENGTVLYTAKIDQNNKAQPDEKIIEACSLLTMNQLMMFFKEHGIAQHLP
jgi:hypothetical protein